MDKQLQPERSKDTKIIKIKELLSIAKSSNIEFPKNISDKKLNLLAKSLFTQILESLDSIDGGVLRVPGFGNFKVQQGVKAIDGKQMPIRRIVFRPAQAKSLEKENLD